MIAAMDDGLGKIRAKLRTMGEEKNTLIVFIGDNGAPLHEGAWDGSLNLPLVGEKGMLTDGGIRTPFVASWPGRIPAGQVYKHPVSSLDVAATAVALAGLPHDANLDGVNLMPFVTGVNQSAPHDALYWRWRSQSAVLEFPWKLIHLGKNEEYLFDVTTPEGETKNLLSTHPDIAVRLNAKLKSWSATLHPPGPPEPNNAEDNMFFATHVDNTLGQATNPRAERKQTVSEGSIQGWIGRNGRLAVKNGALLITADTDAAPNVRPFLTTTDIDLIGPVMATLRVRANTGGASTITWRTRAASFAPEQTAAFDWPASTAWQEIKVELTETNRIIHIRINPAKSASGIEIQSIEFRGADGKTRVWRFDSPKGSTP